VAAARRHLQLIAEAKFGDCQPTDRRNGSHVVSPHIDTEDGHVVPVSCRRIHGIHDATALEELDRGAFSPGVSRDAPDVELREDRRVPEVCTDLERPRGEGERASLRRDRASQDHGIADLNGVAEDEEVGRLECPDGEGERRQNKLVVDGSRRHI
jgi:hypothetical protein